MKHSKWNPKYGDFKNSDIEKEIVNYRKHRLKKLILIISLISLLTILLDLNH